MPTIIRLDMRARRKASCDEWPLVKGFKGKRSLKALITFDLTGIRDGLQAARPMVTEFP